MKRTMTISAVAAAIVVMVGLASVVPIFANTPVPNLSVAITSANVPLNGSFDTFLYVNTPAATSNSLTAVDPNILLTAFVIQSIDFQFVFPDGTTSSGNLITCTTINYPSRGALTTCTGVFARRVMPRAYSGSTTGIYFIGFAGVSPAGHTTLTYTVTGLFQGSTIALSASVSYNVSDPPCCPAGPAQTPV